MVVALLTFLAFGATEPPPFAPQWPLDIASPLSGTFGEHRAGRFHKGLDIATFRETGFPVHAVAEGIIERVSVRPDGFGRAVFIRHPSGMESIYGHLERFENDKLHLEDRITQAGKGRYPGVITLNLPVRQGDVIAYSGESGAGFPHLHLEFRDAQGTTVDPLLYLKAPIPNRRPPRLHTLWLEPLEPDALVQDVPSRASWDLEEKEPGKFSAKLTQTLLLWGKIGVEVLLWDRLEGRNKGAAREIALLVDGQPVGRRTVERIPASANRQAGLLFDIAQSSFFPFMTACRFWSLPGLTLGEGKPPLAGALGSSLLRPGEHRLTVAVTGQSGLKSTLDLPFTVQPPIFIEQVKNLGFDETKGSVEVVYAIPGRTAEEMKRWNPLIIEVQWHGFFNGQPVDRALTLSLENDSPTGEGNQRKGSLTIPLPTEFAGVHGAFRLRGIRGGTTSNWYWLSKFSHDEQPLFTDTPEVRCTVQGLEVTASAYPEAIGLMGVITFGDGRQWHIPFRYDGGRWAGLVPVTKGMEGSYTLELATFSHEAEQGWKEQGEVRVIGTEGGFVESPNGSLEVPKGSLFFPTPLRLAKVRSSNRQALRPVGEAVRMEPAGIPFDPPAKLTLRPGLGEVAWEQTGLFRWDPVNRWWICQEPPPANQGRDLPVRWNGVYGLFADHTPPVFTETAVMENAVLSPRCFRGGIEVVDDGVGINPGACVLYRDGKAVPSEYDGDRSLLTEIREAPLPPGKYTFAAVAVDKAGNQAVFGPVTVTTGDGPAPSTGL